MFKHGIGCCRNSDILACVRIWFKGVINQLRGVKTVAVLLLGTNIRSEHITAKVRSARA